MISKKSWSTRRWGATYVARYLWRAFGISAFSASSLTCVKHATMKINIITKVTGWYQLWHLWTVIRSRLRNFISQWKLIVFQEKHRYNSQRKCIFFLYFWESTMIGSSLNGQVVGTFQQYSCHDYARQVWNALGSVLVNMLFIIKTIVISTTAIISNCTQMASVLVIFIHNEDIHDSTKQAKPLTECLNAGSYLMRLFLDALKRLLVIHHAQHEYD